MIPQNSDLKTPGAIYLASKKSKVKYWFIGLLTFMLGIIFLPWTQNIKAQGGITTLSQEKRPQEINSPIAGKIVKWYVREGDIVKKGDTILQLSEIKENYLDPNLVQRAEEQVQAKKGAIDFYKGKVGVAGEQIDAMQQGRALKIEQLQNKLEQTKSKLRADRAELSAAETEYTLAQDQYNRQQNMYEEGLVSQTELQKRSLSLQKAQAKKISLENKLMQTQQELTIVELEQNSTRQEYSEKISKAKGERFESYTSIATGQGEVAKLQNQVSNYIIRNGMYIITAPQDGQIVQAKKSGLGEILKEGETISIIVPTKIDYAVEMFVRPIDLPLMSEGQKVSLVFDGFPAIVFSGWPAGSFGTFAGTVVAYENTIGPNGKFRVLIAEDSTDRPWPPQLRIGSGTSAIAFIKDVPIWYEMWRNINGFPPDYYTNKADKTKATK